MALDIISKHALVIAVISSLVHIPPLLEEKELLEHNIRIINFDNGFEVNYFINTLENIIVMSAAVVAGITLILGILKRNQCLLVLWLLLEIVYSLFIARYYANRRYWDFRLYLGVVALQALIFYPICYLLLEIRRKNAATKSTNGMANK